MDTIPVCHFRSSYGVNPACKNMLGSPSNPQAGRLMLDMFSLVYMGFTIYACAVTVPTWISQRNLRLLWGGC